MCSEHVISCEKTRRHWLYLCCAGLGTTLTTLRSGPDSVFHSVKEKSGEYQGAELVVQDVLTVVKELEAAGEEIQVLQKSTVFAEYFSTISLPAQ